MWQVVVEDLEAAVEPQPAREHRIAHESGRPVALTLELLCQCWLVAKLGGAVPVADGVTALRSPARGMLLITHYQRVLSYVVPDHVHMFAGGVIVASGDKDLARELEEKGYADFAAADAA